MGRTAGPPHANNHPVGKSVPDEFVLLCETCGYDIDGLATKGACPECGRPVKSSAPANRAGSGLQRSAGFASDCREAVHTLMHPRRAFDAATPGAAQDGRIRESLFAAAGLIATVGMVASVVLTRMRRPGPIDTLLFEGLSLVAIATALYFWLEALTWIEQRGIRFWGPRRGWRITPAIARTICAHASVGWVLGSVLMVAGHPLGLVLADIPNRHNLGIFRGPMQLAPISLPLLGFLAGMLTFEVLVYIGMTRMKFANREKPAPSPLDASMPPASMPSSALSPPSEAPT